jgi:hypothetical protein
MELATRLKKENGRGEQGAERTRRGEQRGRGIERSGGASRGRSGAASPGGAAAAVAGVSAGLGVRRDLLIMQKKKTPAILLIARLQPFTCSDTGPTTPHQQNTKAKRMSNRTRPIGTSLCTQAIYFQSLVTKVFFLDKFSDHTCILLLSK